MDKITNGWFLEVNSMWPGQAMSLEVEKVLHQEKSQFQDILILKRCIIGPKEVHIWLGVSLASYL